MRGYGAPTTAGWGRRPVRIRAHRDRQQATRAENSGGVGKRGMQIARASSASYRHLGRKPSRRQSHKKGEELNTAGEYINQGAPSTPQSRGVSADTGPT